MITSERSNRAVDIQTWRRGVVSHLRFVSVPQIITYSACGRTNVQRYLTNIKQFTEGICLYLLRLASKYRHSATVAGGWLLCVWHI